MWIIVRHHCTIIVWKSVAHLRVQRSVFYKKNHRVFDKKKILKNEFYWNVTEAQEELLDRLSFTILTVVPITPKHYKWRDVTWRSPCEVCRRTGGANAVAAMPIDLQATSKAGAARPLQPKVNRTNTIVKAICHIVDVGWLCWLLFHIPPTLTYCIVVNETTYANYILLSLTTRKGAVTNAVIGNVAVLIYSDDQIFDQIWKIFDLDKKKIEVLFTRTFSV